jgi:hypothetical protein
VQSSLHLKSAVVVFAAVASLGRVGATQDENAGALPDPQTYAKQIRALEHEVRNLEYKFDDSETRISSSNLRRRDSSRILAT